MKPSSQIFFQVKSDLVYLEEVLLKFEKVKKNWIQSKDWLQCQLALAEGFTNAVRHAHSHKSSETIIDIEIVLNPQEMIIKIWDYGKPFQFKQIYDQQNMILSERQSRNLTDCKTNERRLKVGGRGVEILHKIADELRYDHLPDHRNCLLIKKKLFHQVNKSNTSNKNNLQSKA